jgi:hypothetical protein
MNYQDEVNNLRAHWYFPGLADTGAAEPDAMGLTTAQRQTNLDRTVGIGAAVVGVVAGFVGGKLLGVAR